MTERSFRLLIGVWLVIALWLPFPPAIHLLIAILLIEGVTNWRVPVLVARLRGTEDTAPACLNAFEAERAFRLLIAALLGISLFGLPDSLWWLPWFVGFALIGAGLSGMCPMVQALRRMGLR